MFELVKNSLRATIDFHGLQASLPPVRPRSPFAGFTPFGAVTRRAVAPRRGVVSSRHAPARSILRTLYGISCSRLHATCHAYQMCPFGAVAWLRTARCIRHPDVGAPSVALPRQVKIIISAGKEDVVIKISDEGGGIPRSASEQVWVRAPMAVARAGLPVHVSA